MCLYDLRCIEISCFESSQGSKILGNRTCKNTLIYSYPDFSLNTIFYSRQTCLINIYCQFCFSSALQVLNKSQQTNIFQGYWAKFKAYILCWSVAFLSLRNSWLWAFLFISISLFNWSMTQTSKRSHECTNSYVCRLFRSHHQRRLS